MSSAQSNLSEVTWGVQKIVPVMQTHGLHIIIHTIFMYALQYYYYLRLTILTKVDVVSDVVGLGTQL